jgi:hypothetical protein
MRSVTTVSLFPAFFALAISLLLFSPAWFDWPSIPALVAKRTETRQRNSPVRVWINTRTGLFYCAGSAMYGEIRPGRYLTQTEALQSGYRPWSMKACRDEK